MARKRKSSSDAEAVGAAGALFICFFFIIAAFIAFIFIGGAIAVAIAVGIPTVLLLSIPLYTFKKNRIKVDPKVSISDYWLSKEEKEDFILRHTDWLASESEVSEIEAKIEEIHSYATEQGLSKNIDGSYSRRSAAGKSVIASLTELQEELEEAEESNRRCWRLYQRIALKPQRDWLEDKNKLQERDLFQRKTWTSVIGLVFLGVVSYVLYVTGYMQIISIEYIKNPLMKLVSNDWFFMGKDTIISLLSHQYFKPVVALLISSVITWIFVVILKVYHILENNKFEYSVEEPPKVSIENIDDYEIA